jgi:glycosyltransferase involved in cell wall biosynthesis
MSILYLTTSPAPPFAGTDAVLEEIATLQTAFGGEQISMATARTSRMRFPRQLLGFHRLADIRRAESRTRVTHIFHTVPYCFPVLRLLRNPIVLTVTASVTRSAVPASLGFLRRIHRIVVSNRRDEQILRDWGFPQVEMIVPGIDLVRFATDRGSGKRGPAGNRRPFRLLMASAPWVEKQFDEKGVDALLGAAALSPDVHVTILLRGLLEPDLRKRIRRLGIEQRTQIINEKIDMRGCLATTDAVVLAAKRPDIIKSYPHSLLEALAAGKPVIVSRAIPMADLVEELGAGVVVDEVNSQAVLAAANSIRSEQERYLAGVRRFDPAMFSVAKMVDAYRRIYDAVPR